MHSNKTWQRSYFPDSEKRIALDQRTVSRHEIIMVYITFSLSYETLCKYKTFQCCWDSPFSCPALKVIPDDSRQTWGQRKGWNPSPGDQWLWISMESMSSQNTCFCFSALWSYFCMSATVSLIKQSLFKSLCYPSSTYCIGDPCSINHLSTLNVSEIFNFKVQNEYLVTWNNLKLQGFLLFYVCTLPKTTKQTDVGSMLSPLITG